VFARLTPHVDIGALVDEFAAALEREFDLTIEGRLADRFGHDFSGDPIVRAPRSVWTLTTTQVLTMEFIEGWRLTDVQEASAAGIDCRALAIHGATAFMRQVFELGRYHADLHPANLFITSDGCIAYLDFGITGSVSAEARVDMAHVMAALAYRDADRALRYSRALGVVVPREREAAVRDGLGRLLDDLTRPDGTADVAGFGVGFLRLLAANGVRIPAGYGLLVKSLVTVEGVARMLYPDIDIIAVARPFVTRLLARHFADPALVAERVPAALRAALRELTV
jgi:ubiquinone biosynthesis protein